MRINKIPGAELASKNFAIVLRNAHDEGLVLVGPIGIPNPQFVITSAWYFKVLVNCSMSFIGAGRCGVPLALPALAPFGGHARTIDTPARRFSFGQAHPRGIENWLTGRRGGKAPHVLSLEPEVFQVRRCGDAGTRGRGDTGTRGRGDTATRGRGDAESVGSELEDLINAPELKFRHSGPVCRST